MPASIARRYSELGLETRTGDFAVLPAAAFAPTGAPTDAQLATFYAGNRERYIRPERRVIRYAVFGEDAFGNLPAPTDGALLEGFEKLAPLGIRTVVHAENSSILARRQQHMQRRLQLRAKGFGRICVRIRQRNVDEDAAIVSDLRVLRDGEQQVSGGRAEIGIAVGGEDGVDRRAGDAHEAGGCPH